VIDQQPEIFHVVFHKEEPFFLQFQFATQADSSKQPDFDLMTQRQIELPGQFGDGQLALSEPARISLPRAAVAEIEFALRVHLKIDVAPEDLHWPANLSSRTIMHGRMNRRRPVQLFATDSQKILSPERDLAQFDRLSGTRLPPGKSTAMSEYQYYEFAAIDGPISDEGMRYAEGCSTRASVSRMRWQNTYTFGNFHGRVDTLLKYYDAHFYIANWGSVRLELAFPKGSLPKKAIQPYLRKEEPYETTLTARETGDRYIVGWKYNEEEGGDWVDGEGLMDELLGIREELLRGDYRALFLGWLADFDPEELENSEDAKAVMPPVPAGLDKLSPALKALIQHFPVDEDALVLASQLSQASRSDRIPMASVLAELSESEMRALLARVADGGGLGVMNELNRLTFPRKQTPVGQAKRCADFAKETIQNREVSRKKKAATEEATRQQEAKPRREHLASVRHRAETIWSDLESLIDQKIASAYDQAASRLQELRDAYVEASETRQFQRRIAAFRIKYSNRPGLLRRINDL